MKNILITGGGMGNKGAQSMTFICVTELKKRFPTDRIVLLTLENRNYDEYNFCVQPISYPALKCAVKQWNPIVMFAKRIKREKVQIIEELYKNARMLVDISGYALGSNWADATVDYYLSCFECAEKYMVPVYAMPQSFGPFHYKSNSAIMKRIQCTMSYPERIYAREKEGYDLMTSKFKLHNVRESCDMVLRCKSANPKAVYKDYEEPAIPAIAPNSVAIIPNVRNFDHKDNQCVLGYYRAAIARLLCHGKIVYVLHHSKEDAEICKRIKSFFEDEERVIVLENDFDCFEYEAIVTKLDYIVASRYHSLIHALKNGVPCIALGWATKYTELLKLVHQEDCVLDVRSDIRENEIHAVIDALNKNYSERRGLIEKAVRSLQRTNLFDEIASMEDKQHGEAAF